MFYVYILKCADGTYYTGYTVNPGERLKKHNSGQGAKYTRNRRPCKLVYLEDFDDKASACKREWEIKHRLTRADKEKLISSFSGSLLTGMI